MPATSSARKKSRYYYTEAILNVLPTVVPRDCKKIAMPGCSTAECQTASDYQLSRSSLTARAQHVQLLRTAFRGDLCTLVNGGSADLPDLLP
jgi:hypothetical protein